MFISAIMTPDEDRVVIDPQNRRIVYSFMHIVEMTLQHQFSDQVPRHFDIILSKPNTIFIDTRSKVHCYWKNMGGKKYTVTTIEVTHKGRKCFFINSWYVEKDTTLETIEKFIESEEDKELKEQLEKKIADSKTWMKIVYEENSYLETKKYKDRGITLHNDEEVVKQKDPRKKKKG